MLGSLTNILFTWLNFAVFIALVWYVVVKYILPTIYKDQQDRELYLRNLAATAHQLATEKNEVYQRTLHEREYGILLSERIKRWYDQVHQENAVSQQQQDLRARELINKIATQSAQQSMNHAYAEIVPRVLAITRTDLEKKFTDQDQGKKYLNDIFAFMKQKVS